MPERPALIAPQRVLASARQEPGGSEWLAQLPATLAALSQRWQLTLGEPFVDEASCSWVAPARAPSGPCVLKLALPHYEAAQESAGLRFWSGEPTVRLLDADPALDAMLLEQCTPGTSLRALPEPEQDVVLAGLLRRLWRPAPANEFRPLQAMLEYWSERACSRRASWRDAGLVAEGLQLFEELSGPSPADVLLATDLHAGNVLRAEREPWLVIDPKPFVGDPAYDATQHLLNCRARLGAAPQATLQRLAELTGQSVQRIQLWTFARLAVECSHAGAPDHTLQLARRLAP